MVIIIILKPNLGLNGFEKEKWEFLADAFRQQFRLNLKVAPTRLDLQTIEMRNDESVKEYRLEFFAPLL